MHRTICRGRPAIQARLTRLSALIFIGVAISSASAQPTRPPEIPVPNETGLSGLPEQPAPAEPRTKRGDPLEAYAGGTSAAVMLAVPITTLIPGNVAPAPRPTNPVEGQSQAIQRGMTYFISFNCVGCHAPNGGGGMGPSLSNNHFVYGGEPANIYLSIYQGRPNGMPAWGQMLPDDVIWNIVAYIGSISKEPRKTWGKTISREAVSEEQVPSQYVQSTAPWGSTQRFSAGQKPNRAK